MIYCIDKGPQFWSSQNYFLNDPLYLVNPQGLSNETDDVLWTEFGYIS